MRNFPNQGSNLCLLQWKHKPQPLDYQGSPMLYTLNIHNQICLLFLNKAEKMKNKFQNRLCRVVCLFTDILHTIVFKIMNIYRKIPSDSHSWIPCSVSKALHNFLGSSLALRKTVANESHNTWRLRKQEERVSCELNTIALASFEGTEAVVSVRFGPLQLQDRAVTALRLTY